MRRHGTNKELLNPQPTPPRTSDLAADSIVRKKLAMRHLMPDGRIVVPSSMRSDIMFLWHGIPLTAHLGVNKVLRSIIHHFHWNGMSRDVREHVRKCFVCQMRVDPKPTRHREPGHIVATRPFQFMSMDTINNLPEVNGCTQLLTLVCCYGKYPFGIAVNDERAPTIGLALLREVFQHYGFPTILLSDRAHGFASKGLRWLCKYLGIAKIQTLGLRSCANPVERYHRGLDKSLTVLCNSHRNDWPMMVHIANFGYRISVNKRTGLSPWLITHGANPELPIPVLAGLKRAQRRKGPASLRT